MYLRARCLRIPLDAHALVYWKVNCFHRQSQAHRARGWRLTYRPQAPHEKCERDPSSRPRPSQCSIWPWGWSATVWRERIPQQKTQQVWASFYYFSAFDIASSSLISTLYQDTKVVMVISSSAPPRKTNQVMGSVYWNHKFLHAWPKLDPYLPPDKAAQRRAGTRRHQTVSSWKAITLKSVSRNDHQGVDGPDFIQNVSTFLHD